jgi:hypothetical protein
VSWKLSRTVLKPSRSGDAPAPGNQLRTLSYAILLFPGWIVATRKLRPMKPRFRKVSLKTGPITRDQDPWRLSAQFWAIRLHRLTRPYPTAD